MIMARITVYSSALAPQVSPIRREPSEATCATSREPCQSQTGSARWESIKGVENPVDVSSNGPSTESFGKQGTWQEGVAGITVMGGSKLRRENSGAAFG